MTRLFVLGPLLVYLALGAAVAGEDSAAPPVALRAEPTAEAPSAPAARTSAFPIDVASADTASRGPAPLRQPASAGRFADPAILREGDTYYVYATRTGNLDIPVATSVDLRQWSAPTNALPALPAWAERGRTWAPSVVRRGDGYVMWYTVRERASGQMCISVASAADPRGPFEDRSDHPAICQGDRGGSIDPDVFVDLDGAAFLVWKSEDNVFGQPTSLWAARLDETATMVGAAVSLLSRSVEWQGLIIEGPALTRAGDGYLLFYGANAWATASAAIGYARCATPLGPCIEASTRAPWLAGDATVLGPSGPQFFATAAGTSMMAYHGWDLCVGRGPICRRALFVDELRLEGDRPVLVTPGGVASH
ncbi:MAG: family 43 glycosylhydrolase [Dehalococcoidia bacterium]|nr:family 43 glycosylhydrolase [Dehalococcoidia bacterium]